MNELESPSESREHLREIIDSFDTAMLVTRAPDGGLRSRPLAIADAEPDGELYFATHIDSGKIDEIEADARVNVSMQGKTKFVSVTGRARIERDRTLIARLWEDSWRIWFPQGKDDPGLCLLHIEPEEAEYWDNSGARGLRFLFDAAKALLQRTTPVEREGQNAKVMASHPNR
jgi:general stress protein 26